MKAAMGVSGLITLAQLATSALSMCLHPRVMPDVQDCKMLQENPDPRLTRTDVFAALVNRPGLRKVILLVDDFPPEAMQGYALPQRPVIAAVQEEQFGEEFNKDVDLLTKRNKPDGAIDRIMMKTADKGFSGGIKLAKANPKTTAVLAAAGMGAAAYGLLETYFKTHKTVHVYHRTAKDTSKRAATQTETKAGEDAEMRKRSLAGEQDGEPAQKRGFFAITMAEMAAKKAYKHAKKGGNFIRENPELSVAAGAGAMALGAYGLLQAKMASQQTLTVVDHGGDSGGDGNKKNVEKWVTQGHIGRKRTPEDDLAMNRGDNMLVGRRAPPTVVGDRLVKRKLVLQGAAIAASNPGVVDTITAATERDRESQGSAGRPERISSPFPSILQRAQPTLGEEALSNRMDLLIGGTVVVGAASVTLATMLRILRSQSIDCIRHAKPYTWADGGCGAGWRGKYDTVTTAMEKSTPMLKRGTSALMAKARKGLKTKKGKLILGGMVIKSAISVGVLYHFYNKAAHTPPKATTTSAAPADDHGIDAINDDPGPTPQPPPLPRV